jgi:hypothetical protein
MLLYDIRYIIYATLIILTYIIIGYYKLLYLHYYQSGVQFISLNNYGTLKMK